MTVLSKCLATNAGCPKGDPELSSLGPPLRILDPSTLWLLDLQSLPARRTQEVKGNEYSKNNEYDKGNEKEERKAKEKDNEKTRNQPQTRVSKATAGHVANEDTRRVSVGKDTRKLWRKFGVLLRVPWHQVQQPHRRLQRQQRLSKNSMMSRNQDGSSA